MAVGLGVFHLGLNSSIGIQIFRDRRRLLWPPRARPDLFGRPGQGLAQVLVDLFDG